MPDNSDSPQLFHCPNCGAALPDPKSARVSCEYCGSQVLVPEQYRPKIAQPEPIPQAEAVVIRLGPEISRNKPGKQSSIGRVILVVALLIVAFGLGMTILVGAGVIFAAKEVVNLDQVITTEIVPESPDSALETVQALVAQTEDQAPTEIPFASLVLQFGAEGSGPGQFDDARQISVDPQGYIFIADYDTGRLQQFDPAGNFLQMWRIEPDRNGNNYVSDLAAGFDNRIYVVRSGDILIYQAGEVGLVNTIPGEFPETYHSGLAIDPSNRLYSLAQAGIGDDLIQLEANGSLVRRVPDIISAVDSSTPPEDDVIAVDGLGNTYFLSVFEPQVYKYDIQGRYLDRFGSPGNQAGFLGSPSKLAVDSQGRIYILDRDYIQVFDNSGLFLNALKWDYSLGTPRDIALDINGYLYVITSKGQALKYRFNW